MGAGIQTLTTLSGTETVKMDNGGAVLSEATTALIAGLWGSTVQKNTNFTSVAVTSGQTVTLSPLYSVVAITQTQTTSALTVTLPTPVVNGQTVRFSTTNIVTTLTVNAGGSDTITGAPTAGTVGGTFGWFYQASNTTWYRYL